MKWLKLALVCLTLLALLPSLSSSASPSIPALTSPVVDTTGILSTSEQQKLAAVLANYYSQTKNQLQVLIIKSLDGDSIEEYSIRVAEQWRIGLKPGTGVILLVAVEDRQLRIEVGSALEGSLTDAQAGRIINDIITPSFRQQQFYEGIGRGLAAIAQTLGTPLSDLNFPPPRKMPRGGSSSSVMFWILIVFIILSGILRPRRSSWFGLGPFIGGGGGGWSGGSGSSFGGGGWSGGGGGFSGGGASGRW